MSHKPLPSTFDAHASQYDRDLNCGLSFTGEGKDFFAEGRVRRLAELLAERAVPVKRVLDYGSGTGGAIGALRSFFSSAAVCATDLSSASLEIARAQHPTALFLELDRFAAAGPFDLCYCNGVFHHIPPAERDRCLVSIFRSLRAGGWFALCENNPLNLGTRWVMSRIPFDRDALVLTPWESVHRLRRAGFEVETLEFLFFFPRALARLRPLERFLYHVPLGGQYLVLARRER